MYWRMNNKIHISLYMGSFCMFVTIIMWPMISYNPNGNPRKLDCRSLQMRWDSGKNMKVSKHKKKGTRVGTVLTWSTHIWPKLSQFGQRLSKDGSKMFEVSRQPCRLQRGFSAKMDNQLIFSARLGSKAARSIWLIMCVRLQGPWRVEFFFTNKYCDPVLSSPRGD